MTALGELEADHVVMPEAEAEGYLKAAGSPAAP